MLNILKIGLLIIISLLLQVTIIARISVFGSRLDLLLALVVGISLLKGALYGEVIGFISGLIYDIFSGGPLGANSFIMVIVGYGVGVFHDKLYSENAITQVLFGFVTTLVAKFFTTAYLGLFADSRLFSIKLLGLVLVAMINSLLVMGFCWILREFLKVKKVE